MSSTVVASLPTFSSKLLLNFRLIDILFVGIAINSNLNLRLMTTYYSILRSSPNLNSNKLVNGRIGKA